MSPLCLQSVSVKAGKRLLVSGVSVKVEQEEWMGIIGPNGAGKTTLLKAVAGQVRFEGRIELDGRDASEFSAKELAKNVAVVPQRPVHPQGMRVIDYVLLGRTPHLGRLGREAPEDIEFARSSLALLDVEHLGGRVIDSLSGGEAQRVVMARALAQHAPLLLLDEPTNSLDIGRGQHALALVDSFRRSRGLTVVSAMHDLTLASQFCDRLVLIASGKIVAEGSAEEVVTPENIRRYYGAVVEVDQRIDGKIVVIPVHGVDVLNGRRRSEIKSE